MSLRSACSLPHALFHQYLDLGLQRCSQGHCTRLSLQGTCTFTFHHLNPSYMLDIHTLFYTTVSLEWPAYTHHSRFFYLRFTRTDTNIQFIHMDRTPFYVPSAHATLLPRGFMPVSGSIAVPLWTSLPTTMEPKVLWHHLAKKEKK